VESHNEVLFWKSVVKMWIQLYNKEPEIIKKLHNFKPFKKELKSLLLGYSFYSVDEFLQF
jgi:hypothetical protein